MKMENVSIQSLGECKIESPLHKEKESFIEDEDSVITKIHKGEVLKNISSDKLEFFEIAGPREKNYFDNNINCGIVTCGGLCPGINDVIRGIVIELYKRYGVKNILGFRYGYRGLSSKSEFPQVVLEPASVDEIHTKGGTVLGSSRGQQDLDDMLKTLLKYNIKILFAIGGDGTIRGASELAKYIISKKLDISVIAIPKTIDNDIYGVEKSFGFETAVQEAAEVIKSAHEEAKGAVNGISLVKLMGREAGFIAAYTTLANSDVNYCLIPEKKLRLFGENGLLDTLRKRLEKKEHAVIVVAEGVGQDLLNKNNEILEKDASGNLKLKDIGLHLKDEINKYFRSINMEVNLKYFDPSYSIRSVPANAMDSVYCVILAQSAVHAGMAGKTNMLVSYINNHYVYIPIDMAIKEKKRINPNGRIWRTILDSTLQPSEIFND